MGRRGKILDAMRAHGATDDPLVLVAKVSDRPDFDVPVHGYEILFGEDGIWSPQRLKRDHRAAVIFVPGTNAYAPAYAQRCLFVRPSVDVAALPSALLRLPHVHGPDGSERHEGALVASIAGLV